MDQHTIPPAEGTADVGVNRRSLMGRVGAGAASAVALGALATGGAALTWSTPAQAQTFTDADILNFALNLEYIEAEYYLRAFLGTGLQPTDITGTGTPGGVLGGSQVPFKTPLIAAYAQKLAIDETNHVRFLRRALGSTAVARPQIDLLNSFNILAAEAGLVTPGTQFNPFLNETNFILGSFVFEDVGVTAYAGAAGLLTNPANVSAAASILAIEAYHAGTIRATIGALGLQSQANAISALRAKAGSGGESPVSQPAALLDDQPLLLQPAFFVNTSPSDGDSLAYRRQIIQVLSIVYNGIRAGGGFLPNQANGTFR